MLLLRTLERDKEGEKEREPVLGCEIVGVGCRVT